MAISTKTTWKDGDTVFATDLNRIENNVAELNTAMSKKVTRDADTTMTGKMTFQGNDGILLRRSIQGSWYQAQPCILTVIINGENSAGIVFNRNSNDLAQLAFNQHGIVLRNLSTDTKYTVIHTGNLELVTAVAPAALEE